jgi:putative spermidine/putrescine transport system substrate-binding protein
MRNLIPIAALGLLAALAAGTASAQQAGTSATVSAPAAVEPAAPTPQPPAAEAATLGNLHIATWPGAYGQAQKAALFDPFTKDTGTQIEATAQVGEAGISGNDWDVADLPAGEAAALCEKGVLEPIDPAALKAAPDGTAAAADFLPGGIDKCAVGSLAWSSVILYLAEGKDAKTGKTAPTPKSIKDFFDIVHFPGKRGLPRNPRYVLELALMADGVAPADVYTQLATPPGLRRALRSLSSIRSQITWWSDPQQSVDLLKSHAVSMTLGYSGRAFMEIATGTKPIKILWDAQIYDVDVWAVSKTARDKADALKFVAYASTSDKLAETARQLPYGPMRRSAVAMVGNHAILGTDLKPFLPTQPDNFATALQLDGTFWRNHQSELAAALEDWIENPPYKSGVGKDITGVPAAAPSK